MQEIKRLNDLVDKLKSCHSLQEKLEVLQKDSNVKKFLEKPSPIRTLMAGLSPECEIILKSIIAIDQAKIVFASSGDTAEGVRRIIDQLLAVESFYTPIGGIVGYHYMMLTHRKEAVSQQDSQETFLPPVPIDISKETRAVDHWILEGVKNLGKIGELYAVGGAADRLNLHDPQGRELPAATMVFFGKTLLERLIDDVAAREYVYYKLFGKQCFIPIAMMTSTEKHNHEQIAEILKTHNWFARGENNFLLFSQPSVPTIDENGNWCLKGPFHLLMKPGGHGVIWKLAQERGVIDWIKSQGRSKVLIRQINNPIAGLDYALLAFTGIGFEKNKQFGFSSCERANGLAEGVNAIVCKKDSSGYDYALTNIEYCNLQKYESLHQTVDQEKFLANTNILFADLKAIERAIDVCFVPGVLINLKSIAYETDEGEKKEQKIARLESTMQNIADVMTQHSESRLSEKEFQNLPAFLTFNKRKKTISTIKKAYHKNEPWLETPQGCASDLLANLHELLQDFCHMKLPPLKPQEFCFFGSYHPALGPLYHLIAQKIRGGRIGFGSDISLQIAELDMENLDLQGSLSIVADDIMGKVDSRGVRVYSESCGKCYLKNVTVRNLGASLDDKACWPFERKEKESLQIRIFGNGEFVAENIVFNGNFSIEVPDGYRVVAHQEKEGVRLTTEEIKIAAWYWQYQISSEEKIIITKKERHESADRR